MTRPVIEQQEGIKAKVSLDLAAVDKAETEENQRVQEIPKQNVSKSGARSINIKSLSNKSQFLTVSPCI